MPKKHCKLLILGLDGVGKTTILNLLKFNKIEITIPTIGFNIQQLHYKNINFLVWDIGGQNKLRNLWQHFYQNTKGLIYIIDSSDNERLLQAVQEFHKVILNNNLSDAVILILANKRDISQININTIQQKLEIAKIKRNWAIFPITAINKQNNGLAQAMDWLLSNINDVKNPKTHIQIR